MNQIKNRILRLENRLDTSKPETLEDQKKAFELGKYGNLTTMAVVAAYREGGKDVLRNLPPLLADWFHETLRNKKKESVVNSFKLIRTKNDKK